MQGKSSNALGSALLKQNDSAPLKGPAIGFLFLNPYNRTPLIDWPHLNSFYSCLGLYKQVLFIMPMQISIFIKKIVMSF